MLFAAELKYLDLFFCGKIEREFTTDDVVTGLKRIDTYLATHVLEDQRELLLNHYSIKMFYNWFIDNFGNNKENYEAFRQSLIYRVAGDLFNTRELDRCNQVKMQLSKDQIKAINLMLSQRKYLLGTNKYIQVLFSTGEFMELSGKYIGELYVRSTFYLLFFYGGNVLYYRTIGKDYVGGYHIEGSSMRPLKGKEISTIFYNIPSHKIPQSLKENALSYDELPNLC